MAGKYTNPSTGNYTNANPDLNKRQKHEILRRQLENERSSFDSHWRELGDYILPRRPRFNTTETNKGNKVNQKIIDATGTLAVRTLMSGMMGGITSPARPWFKLTTADPDLADYSSVKQWLDVVSRRMSTMYLRSNLYNALPIIYKDMSVFGTGCMLIEEDFDRVIRCYTFGIGSYYLANNEKMIVDTFFRNFRMTVRQLVLKFGERDVKTGRPKWENFSSHVKYLWDRGEHEQWIDVCHIIQPNEEYDQNKLEAEYMPFASCYYEKGNASTGTINYLNNDDHYKYLRESGYDYFPVLAPRWETNSEDVYGTDCPGMVALGDIKQLQFEQKQKAQAIEKMHKPPMVGSPELRNVKASILSGDITYIDESNGQQKFRPAYEVNPQIQHLTLDIQEQRRIIQRAFYEDLFLLITSMQDRQRTAREIDERHEEKLFALGPMLEQLNQDLLNPNTDISFYLMNKQGLLPPPPPELEGQELKVEYVSIMAQAQKMMGIANIERLVTFVGNIVGQTKDLSHADKLDIDQTIDRYSERLGVDTDIIRTDEAVAEIREGRAQVAKQQQMMANMEQATGAAKNLAGANLEEDNALSRILKNVA